MLEKSLEKFSKMFQSTSIYFNLIRPVPINSKQQISADCRLLALSLGRVTVVIYIIQPTANEITLTSSTIKNKQALRPRLF